jgi:hypothetical protein
MIRWAPDGSTHTVSREVQLGLVAVIKAIVQEELIDTEVTDYQL